MFSSKKFFLAFYIATITFGITYFVCLISYYKPHVKEFDLNGGTFDQTVHVIITEDTAYALNYVRAYADTSATNDDFVSRGTTFPSVDGSPIIVWLPNTDDDSVVDHELLHASIAIMNWAGIELSGPTEETYAYELQYLKNQFNNK